MPARTKERAIRSGRFKSNAATLVIAKLESAASYRVFNAGENTFNVTATDGTPEPLLEGCSVDVPLAGTQQSSATITIGRVNNARYVGVFDVISDGSPIRSGRFQSDATATLTIIQNNSGLYRVFNTSDGEIAITLAGGFVGTIAKNCSLDFSITNPVTVAATAGFQGVYDRLVAGADVRSGRFKHTVVAGGGGAPVVLKMIDVGSASSHRYRITNAGKRPAQDFSIKTSQNGTSWTELVPGVRLQPDQSFDFQVKSDGSTRMMVGVEGTIGRTITGIVEYLGPTP